MGAAGFPFCLLFRKGEPAAKMERNKIRSAYLLSFIEFFMEMMVDFMALNLLHHPTYKKRI